MKLQAEAVSGVHVPPPQTFAVPPPPQVWSAGQGAEQLSEPPQPLPMIPQYWPPEVEHVTCEQLDDPHVLAIPAPPQV